jgi:hypothetical protein
MLLTSVAAELSHGYIRSYVVKRRGHVSGEDYVTTNTEPHGRSSTQTVPAVRQSRGLFPRTAETRVSQSRVRLY